MARKTRAVQTHQEQRDWYSAACSKLSAGEAKIAAMLLLHINAEGTVWPSAKTLAESCHVNVRTARRAFGELEKHKLAELSGWSGEPGKKTKVWRLLTQKMDHPVRGDSTDRGDAPIRGDSTGTEGCQDRPGGVTVQTERGDSTVTQRSIEDPKKIQEKKGADYGMLLFQDIEPVAAEKFGRPVGTAIGTKTDADRLITEIYKLSRDTGVMGLDKECTRREAYELASKVLVAMTKSVKDGTHFNTFQRWGTFRALTKDEARGFMYQLGQSGNVVARGPTTRVGTGTIEVRDGVTIVRDA